jgi:hypothetical protein
MHKIALLAVAMSALLGGCERRVDEIKDCIAGKAQSIDVGQAMSVLKAAGFDVRRADDAATPAPSTPASALPAQTAAHRLVSLLCNTTVQGQRVSQSLTVDLDADTVNGARADVSDTEIKWTTQSRDGASTNAGIAFTGQVHTLNRMNGDYRFYDEGAMYAAPAPTYQCALESKRLF